MWAFTAKFIRSISDDKGKVIVSVRVRTRVREELFLNLRKSRTMVVEERQVVRQLCQVGQVVEVEIPNLGSYQCCNRQVELNG